MRFPAPCLCGDPECRRCFPSGHSEDCSYEETGECNCQEEEDPRERGDDDGVEYADPRDEMEDRLKGD